MPRYEPYVYILLPSGVVVNFLLWNAHMALYGHIPYRYQGEGVVPE